MARGNFIPTIDICTILDGKFKTKKSRDKMIITTKFTTKNSNSYVNI